MMIIPAEWAFLSMNINELKECYDKLPNDKKSEYNTPDWDNDSLFVLRAKVIITYMATYNISKENSYGDEIIYT